MKSLFGAIGRGMFSSTDTVVLPEVTDDYQLAEVPVDTQEFELPTFRVWQISRADVNCVSYLIVCERQAIVIDPLLDIGLYQRLAHKYYAQIAYVLDTHEHRDHISGGPGLAKLTGAIYLPAREAQQWLDSSNGWPGFQLHVDALTLRGLATPGHTPDSLTYELANLAFTGDLFIENTLGQLEQADHKSAVLMWQSASHVLEHLPDSTLILPSHVPVGVGGPAMMELSALREKIRPVLSSPTFLIEDLLQNAD